MQLKPAFQWVNEQQAPCKIAIIQLQGGGGDQERTVRNVLNAAGIKYTINRQMATLHGNLSGLDGRAMRGMADLLATRPIYRPDLNLTKDNMNASS